MSGRSLRSAAATPSLVRRAGAGRVEPVRVGVRIARQPVADGVGVPETRDEFAADDLAAGRRRLGDIEIEIERDDQVESVTLDWSLRNVGDAPVQVEAAVLGLRWSGVPTDALRFLRHGWQSWSFTGALDLDERGTEPFPSGGWLRGMHHAQGEPPADRAGWHESDIVSVVGTSGSAVCLAGVLESGAGFGSVYLRRDGDAVRIEIEVRLEVPLEPGEQRRLESVRVALDGDEHRLLERFAALWGRRAGARTTSRFQAGWCSWYHFFHDVSEADLLRNLEALAADREGFPVDVVQLDDGYQSAIGDWLETNEKFPRGLAPLAEEIRAAGFTAGLWTAPFCAVPESRLAREHPDWLLRHGDEPFLGLMHAVWTPTSRVYALDTTRDEVNAHLEFLYAQLVEMGFHYLKLDFLHAAAMRAGAADPRRTRAERLRLGLEAVRRGAGEEAFLLGCGCPLGPAVGVVDAMRIGPDVAPSWGVESDFVVPGLEPALPSLESALRSVLHRAWMHRRLWINDPDCLMARSRDTRLTAAEVRSLAALIAVTGGMPVVSDDVAAVDARGRGWVRETLGLARAVDAMEPDGAVRVASLLASDGPRVVSAAHPGAALAALFNDGDTRIEVSLELGALGIAPEVAEAEPRLDSAPLALDAGRASVTLEPHDTSLQRFSHPRPLAVFCDFDGTFSVQDVGASLAQERAGELRGALWKRFAAGELDAWGYAIELFDGFELPREELDAFLRRIELDAGAAALLAWCADRSVPFRILSDGFDHNLVRLQELNDVRFEFGANRLRYEGDRWRIAPGAPNPECPCGTGSCKRGLIATYRASHPGSYCVHVGNGWVSDLCGAMEADLAFAKDTLAPALEVRGVAFEPFDSLHDVIAGLERRLG